MVGEDRSGEIGVNLYSSTNLKDWKFLHKIITPNTNPQLKSGRAVHRTPEDSLQQKTKQYVVWLHYEGKGYAPAEAAVFKCDKIDGDYEFVKDSARWATCRATAAHTWTMTARRISSRPQTTTKT